jgi:cell division protein FtsW (lipid II flippase)
MAQLAQATTQVPGRLQRYRWKELSLLILPGIILVLCMIQLLLTNLDPKSSLNFKQLPIGDGLIPILGFIAAALVVHVIFTIFFRKADQILFPVVILLTGLGVIMMTRLGPDLGINNMGSRQLLWAILGMVVCVGVMFGLRNISWLSRYKYTWMLFCIAVLVPALVHGLITFHSADTTPTRDVLGFGPLKIQPSEFLKIGVAIFFAGYFNDNLDVLAQGYYRIGWLRLPPLRQLGPLVFILGISLLSFLVIRELGLAMLIYSLFLCLTYVATGKASYIIFSLGAFVVLGLIGYVLLSYVRNRFAAVAFNPLVGVNTQAYSDYVQNGGLQIFQGLLNLASGGIMGTGLGLGAPAMATPVIDSDMVLTAYGEELGLVGLFAIIGLYLFVIYRGFRIAAQANDNFSKLLATGLTSVFALQTLIISAGDLKIMPLTGIPLPFLSNGVNALVSNFIIIGILLRISHNTAVENEGEY